MSFVVSLLCELLSNPVPAAVLVGALVCWSVCFVAFFCFCKHLSQILIYLTREITQLVKVATSGLVCGLLILALQHWWFFIGFGLVLALLSNLYFDGIRPRQGKWRWLCHRRFFTVVLICVLFTPAIACHRGLREHHATTINVENRFAVQTPNHASGSHSHRSTVLGARPWCPLVFMFAVSIRNPGGRKGRRTPQYLKCHYLWGIDTLFDSTLGYPGEGPRYSQRKRQHDRQEKRTETYTKVMEKSTTWADCHSQVCCSKRCCEMFSPAQVAVLRHSMFSAHQESEARRREFASHRIKYDEYRLEESEDQQRVRFFQVDHPRSMTKRPILTWRPLYLLFRWTYSPYV